MVSFDELRKTQTASRLEFVRILFRLGLNCSRFADQDGKLELRSHFALIRRLEMKVKRNVVLAPFVTALWVQFEVPFQPIAAFSTER